MDDNIQNMTPATYNQIKDYKFSSENIKEFVSQKISLINMELKKNRCQLEQKRTIGFFKKKLVPSYIEIVLWIEDPPHCNDDKDKVGEWANEVCEEIQNRYQEWDIQCAITINTCSIICLYHQLSLRFYKKHFIKNQGDIMEKEQDFITKDQMSASNKEKLNLCSHRT